MEIVYNRPLHSFCYKFPKYLLILISINSYLSIHKYFIINALQLNKKISGAESPKLTFIANQKTVRTYQKFQNKAIKS